MRNIKLSYLLYLLAYLLGGLSIGLGVEGHLTGLGLENAGLEPVTDIITSKTFCMGRQHYVTSRV